MSDICENNTCASAHGNSSPCLKPGGALPLFAEEDFTASLKGDIESFFQQKYGPLSFQYNYVTPKEHNTAKIDFIINGDNDFMRRYVGAVSYVDGQLSLQNVVRLW